MRNKQVAPRELERVIKRAFPGKKVAMDNHNYRIERTTSSVFGVDMRMHGPQGIEPLYFSSESRVTTREDNAGIAAIVIRDGDEFVCLSRVPPPVPKEEKGLKYEM